MGDNGRGVLQMNDQTAATRIEIKGEFLNYI